MSTHRMAEPAACFLSLSEKLAAIFKHTSDRINQISESLSAAIDAQPGLLRQPAARPAINPPGISLQPKLPTLSSEPPPNPQPPGCPPSPTNSPSTLKPLIAPKNPPRTPPTPSEETFKTVTASTQSERRVENRTTSAHTSPPRRITSPRHDPEDLAPITKEEDSNPSGPDQALSAPAPPAESRQIPLNLRERIGLPPPPPPPGPPPTQAGHDHSESPDPAQTLDRRTSPTSRSSPMDMKDSDPPRQVTPHDQTRSASPRSSSSPRAGHSTRDSSSRTRSSSRRRSRSPSSRSSDQRYRRNSLRSPSRRASISRRVDSRPYVYDSYKPTLNPRTRRRSRSPPRRSRSPHRRSPSPSRRSRSAYRRTPSPRSRRSRSRSRQKTERAGSRRPSSARFIDRIDSREDRDFAEYLDATRGDPSYKRLKDIMRSLHGPDYSGLVISQDLWETFPLIHSTNPFPTIINANCITNKKNNQKAPSRVIPNFFEERSSRKATL
ncbi:hypothetical protein PtB15_2B478 [Puccinia triticina]|nr:hypothetical protein PtB15_2B478 [Puccinia triticina]